MHYTKCILASSQFRIAFIHFSIGFIAFFSSSLRRVFELSRFSINDEFFACLSFAEINFPHFRACVDWLAVLFSTDHNVCMP